MNISFDTTDNSHLSCIFKKQSISTDRTSRNRLSRERCAAAKHTVNRDSNGSINYAFYQRRARSLLSDALFSFFGQVITSLFSKPQS